ncbi:hypothetical protein [Dysgonomonas macrotermitis]|uniref:Uncharacterized protein n=1 Tax=Dysgonomonas macrotermitis TaxID=1346286 RepID=A0A1M5AT68_9BACT|nr:hypothetical protein [Dysgonomonas macrotermitis]SHF33142.1 hypothetical protein SAMN05444362_105145 [Dysgonomonas macrotermitis]
MKRTVTLSLLILFAGINKGIAQKQDSINEPKSFVNLGFIGYWSTNGDDTDKTTNNISIALIYADIYRVNGLSISPFSKIEKMNGLQLGVSQGAAEMNGVQIGVGNGAGRLKGIQIGMFNVIGEKSGGVQLGLVNSRKSGGLQIGFVNLADENDYPIGLVNIIKNGDMYVGLMTDEMSSATATFRSGGKYLYGIAGFGHNFASSLNHWILEGGIGVHVPVIPNRLRIDSEITATLITKFYGRIHWGDPEEAEKKAEEYNYKEASRYTVRILPTYRFGKRIELFGGPSLNYLQSHCMENTKIFPSNYMWRKFTSSSLKQIYWGWTIGVQYKL